MKRRTFAVLSTSLFVQPRILDSQTGASDSSTATPSYESPGVVVDNLPVFFEQLKDELTPSPGWGELANAGLPALATRASMLVSNGGGPFPAVLLLHDHGAKFDIGKEMLVRPWYDAERLASAREWSDAATLKHMMVPGNNTLRGQSAYFMLHPGLYRYLDIPGVASIAAPKPLMCFDGENDPLFSVDGMEAAYEKLRVVWRSRGCGRSAAHEDLAGSRARFRTRDAGLGVRMAGPLDLTAG